MSRFILLIVFLIAYAFAEPVQTELVYEGKKLRLNGDFTVPEGVKPSEKPVILLVHGLFQTHKMREPIGVQREAWLSEGYPVLAITLSLGIDNRTQPYDCSKPLDHDYELNLKEIGRWVEWLKDKGVKSIVLAGHSFGGQQVILYASTAKDSSIKGVIALAPANGVPREHKLLEKAKKLVKDGKGNTLLKTNFFYCNDVKVSARTLWSYYGIDKNIGKALKKIDVPVLVAVGGMDERTPDLDKFLKPFIKEKKNMEIVVIDFADHFFRDLAAEDLSTVTLEFLGKLK